MIKNNIPIEKKEKVHVSTLNGSFFHEKTNSGFIQVNRIEGNSVQNGTPTPDNPIEVKSFSGEVVTSGKNLIDMDYLMNYFNNKYGYLCVNKETDGSYKFALKKGNHEVPIALDSNKRYAMRFKYKNPYVNWGQMFQFIFTDGTFVDGIGHTANIQNFEERTFVIPKGKEIKSFVINARNGDECVSFYKDCLLEVLEDGQEAPTEYEPFHATKTEKLTLRSLPNGVKDTLERQSDGSYLLTQRCKEFVLDGSENWSNKRGDSPTERSVFQWNNDIGVYYWIAGNADPSLVKPLNYYSSIGFSVWSSTVFEGIGGYTKNGDSDTRKSIEIMINLKTSRLATDDVNGLKAWLKANPVTCVMELIQPIQRKLWLSPLSAYEGQTNIFANSEVGAEMEVEVLTINAVNEVVQSNNEYIFQERPNPNLLVNSDFRNPINTSGKKEWTNYSEWDKVLDGWNINNVTSTVLLTKPGVKVKQSGEIHYGTFGQYFDIENSKNIMGKKITLSFYCRDLNAINFRVMFYIAPNYHVDKVWSKTIDVKLGFNEVTADIPVFDGNILAVYFYSEGESSFFELEWVKLEIGERATPMPLAKFEDEWNRLKVIKQERLLWSGSMATGQSAVVDGLSNFKKFKAYINNTGIVILDFIGTEGGGKRKFTGEFYNYSSNNEEILAFCSAFINDNTFTNVMSNYVSLKNVAVHYENPIIQIWGIY